VMSMKRAKTADESRRRAYRRGLLAETVAGWFLRLRGYRILARRARTPFGEIDLVARRRDLLIFVEVKQRRTRDAALHAVTPRQQARIARASLAWLARHPGLADCNYRFDMILVQPYLWPQHVTDAFSAELAGMD